MVFSGHERPDVVVDRNERYIPFMRSIRPRLLEYNKDDPTQVVEKPYIPGARQLVLVTHDESAFQAHDAQSKSWVFDNQHKLRKKGAGRGRHESQVLCVTEGWLRAAGEGMDYGKNHDGYWTGERFCNQVHFIYITCSVKHM